MNEKKWLSSKSPGPMLGWLKETDFSQRKLRLWVVACCRLHWHRFKDPRSRDAIDVAERFAEGTANWSEFDEANEEAHLVAGYGTNKAVWCACCAVCDDWAYAPDGADIATNAQRVVMLREVFGNPFRPAGLDAAWRTANVVNLAKVI